MVMGSGLAARMIYAKEPTQNTREVPDHHIGFVQHGIQGGPARVPVRNLYGGRKLAPGWTAGNKTFSGPISVDLVPESTGEWLELNWGSVVTAGSDPYTHTVTPGTMSSSTIQLITPDSGGTERVFEYTGCMVTGGTLSFDASGDGNPVNLNSNVVAHDLSLAQSAVAESFPTVSAYWTSVEASLTLAGAAVPVQSFTLNFDNGIRSIHEAKSTDAGLATISESGMHTFGGTLQADFDDLTLLNYFLNDSENALVATVSDGTYSLVITMNVRYDGDLTTVSGPEVVTQPLTFEAVSATSDAAAFTAVLTNGDSAA